VRRVQICSRTYVVRQSFGRNRRSTFCRMLSGGILRVSRQNAGLCGSKQ
jgi:hypothetical protein